MRWLAFLLTASLSLGVSAQATMKMATATINDVQHEWLKRFDAAMKPHAARLKIEIYPASQLGQIPRMVEGVAVGTIESFVTPTSFLVSVEPRYQVFDAIGEDKGLKGIGIFYNSPIIVLARRPIERLADFNGKKIRVFGTPLQIEPMKKLGASPVPMAFGEVIAALQNGTVDGMLAGMPVLTPMKFYDVAKNVTEIHPSIVTSIQVVNKKWFEGLPSEVQAAMLAAGERVDQEAFSFATALVDKANKDWQANGGQLLRLPEAEQAKLMVDLKAIGTQLLSANPAIKTEYDELLKVAERTKGTSPS